MPNAKNERSVTGRIADFLLQRLIAVYGISKHTSKLKTLLLQAVIGHYYDVLLRGGVLEDTKDLTHPRALAKFHRRQLSADSFKKFKGQAVGFISLLPELRELPLGSIIVQPEACHSVSDSLSPCSECWKVMKGFGNSDNICQFQGI